MIRLIETQERGYVNLTVLATSFCTLKCELCATYTPYAEKPRHYDVNVLIKSVSRFFDCIDKHIGIVTISGGEPFMHPGLPGFIDFLTQYYADYEMIEIITNGTIVPSDKLLLSMKANRKINIMLDDYGALSANIGKVIEKFKSNNIEYRHRKYNSEEA
jgi:molybdenum cofactor biosynthesis enzyme MoaA